MYTYVQLMIVSTKIIDYNADWDHSDQSELF